MSEKTSGNKSREIVPIAEVRKNVALISGFFEEGSKEVAVQRSEESLLAMSTQEGIRVFSGLRPGIKADMLIFHGGEYSAASEYITPGQFLAVIKAWLKNIGQHDWEHYLSVLSVVIVEKNKESERQNNERVAEFLKAIHSNEIARNFLLRIFIDGSAESGACQGMPRFMNQYRTPDGSFLDVDDPIVGDEEVSEDHLRSPVTDTDMKALENVRFPHIELNELFSTIREELPELALWVAERLTDNADDCSWEALISVSEQRGESVAVEDMNRMLSRGSGVKDATSRER